MYYRITFKRRAIKEYNESFSWYEKRSIQAAENFTAQVKSILSKIENQPDLFRKVYKNYRQAKTDKFPYSVVYFIDEEKAALLSLQYSIKKETLN